MSISPTLQQWQAAEHQLQHKQYDLARASYERLVGHAELAPMAQLRLSLLASTQGRYRDAVDAAMAALRSRLADPDLLEMIAKRLSMLGELEAAVACATDPAVLATSHIPTLAELGKMLSDASFPDQALQLLQRARTLGLGTPHLRYLIGLNLMYAGDLDAAQRELEACLDDQAGMPMALWTLSKLGRAPGGGKDRIQQLHAALADAGGQQATEVAMLHYALFAEHDRRGEIEPAWESLSAAMRTRHAVASYDGNAEQSLFDHLGTLGPEPRLGHISEGPRPVFIVGMPRSGTTLLERVLGNHPDVTDAGELHDIVRQLRWCCDLAGGKSLDMALARKAEGVDWSELGRRYLAHTQWRARGRPVYTDKLPANFVNVGYILRALPQARILHMVRGSMDTCFSNIKELFSGGWFPHSYDQVEMADHFRRYRALMKHWHDAFPGRILDVHYDQLVTEPHRVAVQVLEFCGLSLRDGIEAIENRSGTVATASAVQVREPIHQRFLGQWRRYEAHLGPLRERLGTLAD